MKPRQHPGSTATRAALNIVLLAVVAALLVFSIFLVRAKLLRNAHTFGQTLAYSYATEEEQSIEVLRRYALLASQYIDEIAAEGGAPEAVQEWLHSYFAKLARVIGENHVDPYAVISGKIVAANPWQGDATFPYASASWYTRALEAGGELVCSDVYTDAITGQLIFTISKELAQPGDVFALDVYIQNPALHNVSLTLPDYSAFYLCTQDGTLIHWIDENSASAQEAQLHADYLMSGIRGGSLSEYDSSFTDHDGQERGVYYCDMANGWTVILTRPLSTILMGDRNIVMYAIVYIALMLFAALAFMSLRDIYQNQRVKRADDIAHMLGDSFYAIFRVNFRHGMYEVVKLQPDMRGKLPAHGDYSLVLDAIKPLVKSSTYQAFEQSFSLDSIRKRVMQGVPDYGGDYLRRFGEVYRWVNIRTLYDARVAPNDVVLCFRDVDEEKRRELGHLELLQNALDAATSGTRARSEFFSRMSHEMRTPLNAIIGSCELARQGRSASGDEVWEHLGRIEFAGRQLLSLINDILDFSRMEAGKMSMDEREFDLRRLLDDIVGMFRDVAAREGKELYTQLDMGASTVRGDPQKITQIVNNLLSNSLKYSNPGAKVWLSAQQLSPDSYRIVVEDTGIGMSPEFLSHLFDPYARETVFSERSQTGTGLGMPIVKNLVQHLGGDIEVDSKLGHGSKVTVTLPLSGAHDPASLGSAAPSGSAECAPFDWSRLTILVAEDNDLNREILSEMLSALGAQVMCAPDGAQAVRAFELSAPGQVGAILMDMRMPVMDGCQAAQAIRALERADASSVPIIAVTANAYAEDIARTSRAGMNDHISKPIDMALLAQTLIRLISARTDT